MTRECPMPPTIRLQSDSNAHDRPWRVAVEQGFFADEGLNVEYHEDNPKGVEGRVENFSERWKESQLREGALEVYPVCEWGAIERVQQLGKGKIIGLDTTARTGAIMVRKDSRITSRAELLRDLTPEQRKTGMLPELLGVQGYQPAEFKEKVDWMMERGFLNEAPAYQDVVRGK